MCDYRLESQKAVKNLPVPLRQTHKAFNPNAYKELVRSIRDGRARTGHDLYDASDLSRKSLSMGHYMSPHNFERTLSQMNSNPWQCQWCGARLPQDIIRQHGVPHNHREYIQHHFHQGCWDARLLAIAIIFGHIRPEAVFDYRRQPPERQRHFHPARVQVVEVIKETFRIF